MSPPGARSRPSWSASATISAATRSFTLPPGLRNSALARIWGGGEGPDAKGGTCEEGRRAGWWAGGWAGQGMGWACGFDRQREARQRARRFECGLPHAAVPAAVRGPPFSRPSPCPSLSGPRPVRGGHTSQPVASDRLRMRMSGVPPMAPSTPSTTPGLSWLPPPRCPRRRVSFARGRVGGEDGLAGEGRGALRLRCTVEEAVPFASLGHLPAPLRLGSSPNRQPSRTPLRPPRRRRRGRPQGVPGHRRLA